MQECMAMAAQMTSADKQSAMYVTLSTWYQEQVGDAASAEQALEAALGADPANPTALRALVDIYRTRGELARASLAWPPRPRPARCRTQGWLSLDAADIYRRQL